MNRPYGVRGEAGDREGRPYIPGLGGFPLSARCAHRGTSPGGRGKKEGAGRRGRRPLQSFGQLSFFSSAAISERRDSICLRLPPEKCPFREGSSVSREAFSLFRASILALRSATRFFSAAHRSSYRVSKLFNSFQSGVPSERKPTECDPPADTATISVHSFTSHWPQSFWPTATTVPLERRPIVW